jgi:hypothetical protein
LGGGDVYDKDNIANELLSVLGSEVVISDKNPIVLTRKQKEVLVLLNVLELVNQNSVPEEGDLRAEKLYTNIQSTFVKLKLPNSPNFNN